MERPGADLHRAVHGHSRRCDCQRCLAVDQVRSRLLAGGEPAATSAYAIFFGGALLLGGRLGDLLGRRRLFTAGLALFAASSLLCGLAWSEASLIAFRALQGLGGALLAPAALALLMTTFAEGRDRNRALGIYGAAAGSGAAAGVLLGGVLTSYLSWPWIFFINVPVAVVAIALTPVLLRESQAGLEHRHFDFAGAATITGGLMLLVYALTRATTDGWGTDTTIGLLAGAAALVVAFVVIELRSKAPLLPMRIFRSGTLTAAKLERMLADDRTKATLGWAVYPHEGDNALALYRAASERLYARKVMRSYLRPVPVEAAG